MKTTRILLATVLSFFVFATSAQIDMAPTSGPYGFSAKSIIQDGESIFVLGYGHYYYKDTPTENWQQVFLPEPIRYDFETITLENGELWFYNAANVYSFDRESLSFELVIQYDDYLNGLSIAKNGSAIFINDEYELMYAESNFEFELLLDMEEKFYYYFNYGDIELEELIQEFDIQDIQSIDNAFVVSVGHDKEQLYFLHFVEDGEIIKEVGPAYIDIQELVFDNDKNAYWKDQRTLNKIEFDDWEFYPVQYDGSDMKTCEAFLLIGDGKLAAFNDNKYLFSDDGGLTWTNIFPGQEYISKWDRRHLIKGDNSIWLGNNFANSLIELQEIDFEGNDLNIIPTELPHPIIRNFINLDDRIIANTGSKHAFESFDQGQTWNLFGTKNVLPILNRYYSIGDQVIYESVDGIEWNQIEGYTTNGSGLIGYNNDLFFYGINSAHVVQVLPDSHQIKSFSINNPTDIRFALHPNRKLYYIENGKCMVFDPATESIEMVSELETSIENFEFFINEDGSLIITEYSNWMINVWLSEDNGESFTNHGSASAEIVGIVKFDQGLLYGANNSRLSVSTDKGKSWSTHQIKNSEELYYTCLGFTQEQYVLMGGVGDVVYRSQEPLDISRKFQASLFNDENATCVNENEAEVINQELTLTNESGEELTILVASNPFSASVPPADYEVRLNVDPELWESCEESFSYPLTIDENLEMGIIPNESCRQYEVHYNFLHFRRCFDSEFEVKVCNQGTVESPADETLLVSLDGYQTYLGASEDPISINGNELNFAIGNLAQFDCKRFRIDYQLDCEVEVGKLHCISSQIANENNCSNSPELVVENICQINVASFDPNDMQVILDDKAAMQQIVEPGLQELEYLIRFQNTGTDTAFTVRLETQLDSKLDEKSIQVTDYSHAYMYHIKEEGLLEISFQDILLNFESQNEEESQGYIKFKIDLTEALEDNQTLISQTDIFFDFNEAIQTNKAIVQAKTPSAIDDLSSQTFRLMPNPANDWVRILLDDQSMDYTLTLKNKLGQSLHTQFNEDQIDLTQLDAGVYIVILQQGDKISSRSLVII